MHIPDGFISPATYIPAYAITAGLWYIAFKKSKIENEKITFLASLSALAFILTMIAIPLPGGTSAHLSGVALLSLLFGPWLSFSSISIVLIIEALLFGVGGVTTLGINILAIAFFGSFSADITYKIFKRVNETVALALAGWISTLLPALFIAIILGLQPLIANESGKPLFFPFDFKTTAIALLIPHAVIGIIEALATVTLYKFLKKSFKTVFNER